MIIEAVVWFDWLGKRSMCYCLSCVGAKNKHAKPLKDVGWCSKEALLPSNALLMHGMCCSVASQ